MKYYYKGNLGVWLSSFEKSLSMQTIVEFLYLLLNYEQLFQNIYTISIKESYSIYSCSSTKITLSKITSLCCSAVYFHLSAQQSGVAPVQQQTLQKAVCIEGFFFTPGVPQFNLDLQ